MPGWLVSLIFLLFSLFLLAILTIIVGPVSLRIPVKLSNLGRRPAPGRSVSLHSLAILARPARLSILTPLVVLGRLRNSDAAAIFTWRASLARLMRMDSPPRLTRMPGTIRLARLPRMPIPPIMDSGGRLPAAIRLTRHTRRDSLTRTGLPGRPTRADRFTRPAKMPRLN